MWWTADGQSTYRRSVEEGLLIKRLLNSPVDSNCYIITKSGTDNCLLVDPAQGDGTLLYNHLLANGYSPQYIIVTHEHFDHISSIEHLRQNFGCPLIASAECSQRITHPKGNLSLFRDGIGFTCAPAEVIISEDGFSLPWKGELIRFYVTPGHSEGGLCFSIGPHLFTGDTVMETYKPVVKLPGGNKAKLRESIERLLRVFDGNTQVYPGHGRPFSLAAVTLSTLTL